MAHSTASRAFGNSTSRPSPIDPARRPPCNPRIERSSRSWSSRTRDARGSSVCVVEVKSAKSVNVIASRRREAATVTPRATADLHPSVRRGSPEEAPPRVTIGGGMNDWPATEEEVRITSRSAAHHVGPPAVALRPILQGGPGATWSEPAHDAFSSVRWSMRSPSHSSTHNARDHKEAPS